MKGYKIRYHKVETLGTILYPEITFLYNKRKQIFPKMEKIFDKY